MSANGIWAWRLSATFKTAPTHFSCVASCPRVTNERHRLISTAHISTLHDVLSFFVNVFSNLPGSWTDTEIAQGSAVVATTIRHPAHDTIHFGD
jgi:hypothetical protein